MHRKKYLKSSIHFSLWLGQVSGHGTVIFCLIRLTVPFPQSHGVYHWLRLLHQITSLYCPACYQALLPSSSSLQQLLPGSIYTSLTEIYLPHPPPHFLFLYLLPPQPLSRLTLYALPFLLILFLVPLPVSNSTRRLLPSSYLSPLYLLFHCFQLIAPPPPPSPLSFLPVPSFSSSSFSTHKKPCTSL